MIHFTLQEMQYHIFWPNYRPYSQEYVIDLHFRGILSDWKPCHRLFGVDSCTCEDNDIVVGMLLRMWRVWILLVNVFKCNGFPSIEMSAIHILPFFDTYLGRIEWDSAPTGRNWRGNIHYLIVAPMPVPQKLLQIQQCPTKRITYCDPYRRSSASIALIGSHEGNIKSCIDTPSEFFRAIEPHWPRRHEFGRISNLDFCTDIDVLRLLCNRTQQHDRTVARHYHQINLLSRQ